MKKVLIVLIIAAIACTGVFASGMSLGVMQNYLFTNVLMDMEFDNFGFEAAVGVPLVSGTVGLVEYMADGRVETEGFPNLAEMFLLPGGTVNAYWKAIDGKVFGMRLGIQFDAISLMDKDYYTFIGLAGISLGLNFKINERFSLNVTGTCPVAAPLSMISDEAPNYSVVYYTTKTEDNWSFLLIFPAIFDQLVRVSAKWAL